MLSGCNRVAAERIVYGNSDLVNMCLQLGTLLEVSAISVERSRGVSRYNALAVFEAIRRAPVPRARVAACVAAA